METMKHAFHSAESAFHKDPKPRSGEEPVSGVRGAGTASDPYDTGNVSSTLIAIIELQFCATLMNAK